MTMRSDPVFYAVVGACLAVLVILLIGIGGFARGGEFNRRHANRLMRLRIAAQAVSIGLVLLFVWLRRG